MKNLLKITAVLLIVAGAFACSEKESTNEVTGTVIGTYSNGFFSVLVRVDEKHSIGETIEYVKQTGNCLDIYENGTYENVIQVQYCLPIPEILNKTISFTCRTFNPEKDNELFTVGSGIGNMLCGPPSVPIYVVTDCKILK
jgi:hypothetical protein